MSEKTSIELTERLAGDFLVVAFAQPTRVDFWNADEFAGVLGALLARSKFLALDCANLDFVSSKGLGALIMTLNAIDQAGGMLRLYNLNEAVTETFQTTRMDALFTIVPDEASAIAT